MKRFRTVAAAAVLAMTGFAAFAQNLTGYDIAKRGDEVDEGKTCSYTATLTLKSKKGAVRTREIMCRNKDYGDVKKSVVVFVVPKDVEGVAYLSFDYPDKADGTKPDGDSWLFMPAMKKTRRIAGSGKDDDFMGTDFTYADMGDRGLTKDDFNLLGEEDVDGNPCWKVELIAKDKSEKTQRRILWYRKDNYKVIKGEYYDRQNELARILTTSDTTKTDGIWTTQKMFMQNVKSGHSTLLEMKNVRYNLPLDDKMFTVSAIERGSVR